MSVFNMIEETFFGGSEDKGNGYDDFDNYDGYIPMRFDDLPFGDEEEQNDSKEMQDNAETSDGTGEESTFREEAAVTGKDLNDNMETADNSEQQVLREDAADIPDQPDEGQKSALNEDSAAMREMFTDHAADDFTVTDDCDRVTDPQSGETVRIAYDDEGNPFEPLDVINSVDLMNMEFEKKDFLVEGLLAQGLAVLAGAPKIGKSWMVLHLCMQVAKGEPFLGLPTKKSQVLYIALEDDRSRLQKRLYTFADRGEPNLTVTTTCSPLGEDLAKEICYHVVHHKPTRLIVIDTFQKIRAQGKDMSYANDYSEVGYLKRIADVTGCCVLLVHHTRKLPDDDYMNVISGTNGIAGSADTLMVLQKEKRSGRKATLSCTGRDIEEREMELVLDRKTCVWQLIRDSLAGISQPEMPEEIVSLIAYMKKIQKFEGTSTELSAALKDFCGVKIQPGKLKYSMNRSSEELSRSGVRFVSTRTSEKRTLLVMYDRRSDEDADTVRRNDDG